MTMDDTSLTAGAHALFLVLITSGVVIAGISGVGFASQADIVNENAAANTAGQVDVKIEGPEQVATGKPSQINVSVEGAQTGVSAYDLVFRVTDSETAVFEDINLTTEGNDGPLTDIEYSKGDQRVRVSVSTLDAEYQPSEYIQLLELSVSSSEEESASVELAEVIELKDSDVESYELGESNTAKIKFIQPVIISINEPVSNLHPGSTGTTTVSVSDTNSGVSAFNIGLAVDNGDVATIENVSILGNGENGPLTEVDYTSDGTEVKVSAVLLDAEHAPAESIEIIKVELSGESAGSTELQVTDVFEISNSSAKQYTALKGKSRNVEVSSVESNDDGGSGGGGGGGGGGGSGGGGGGGPTALPTPIPEDVWLLERTKGEIESADGGAVATPGSITSSPVVETIVFDNPDAYGQLEVREYNTTPSKLGEVPGTPVSTTEVIVPREYESEPARLRFNLADAESTENDISAVDTDSLTVVRHTEDGWTSLDTEVVKASGENVIVEAGTPGFSYFVVVEGDETINANTVEQVVQGEQDGGTDTRRLLIGGAVLLLSLAVAVTLLLWRDD